MSNYQPGAATLVATLPYAERASASYVVFKHLKAAGVFEGDVRFLVALPTSLATMDELERILEVVRLDELSVQWDICVETGAQDVMAAQVDAAAGAASAVPDDVELRLHLFYGASVRGPKDDGLLIEVAREILERIQRRVDAIDIDTAELVDPRLVRPRTALALPAA